MKAKLAMQVSLCNDLIYSYVYARRTIIKQKKILISNEKLPLEHDTNLL